MTTIYIQAVLTGGHFIKLQSDDPFAFKACIERLKEGNKRILPRVLLFLRVGRRRGGRGCSNAAARNLKHEEHDEIT